MGLLNQQGKKGDKKSNSKAQKGNAQQSKFISKGSKPAGGSGGKKGMTGGSQRGSWFHPLFDPYKTTAPIGTVARIDLPYEEDLYL